MTIIENEAAELDDEIGWAIAFEHPFQPETRARLRVLRAEFASRSKL